MNIVDISYYYNEQANDPVELVSRHLPSMGYLEHFPGGGTHSAVKFMNYKGEKVFNKVNYYFFEGSHSRIWLPWRQHMFLVKLQADIVVTHGLLFPLQVILLRKQLGNKVKIFIQYHADRPGGLIFQKLQRIADQCVDGYFFAARELALAWLQKGIIKDSNKIYEVEAGSTYFEMKDKKAARQFTGVAEGVIFLWVGRLDQNKDPFTVINAFQEYAKDHADIYLYMIYQNSEMPDQIINHFNYKDGPVRLIGSKPHDELEYWYNSADYFISGSHYESYGYAVCEAMACGCVPIVTDIPSFRQMTGQGKLGQLYEPGNVAALLQVLNKLDHSSVESSREAVASYFESELSFRAIADKIYKIGKILKTK